MRCGACSIPGHAARSTAAGGPSQDVSAIWAMPRPGPRCHGALLSQDPWGSYSSRRALIPNAPPPRSSSTETISQVGSLDQSVAAPPPHSSPQEVMVTPSSCGAASDPWCEMRAKKISAGAPIRPRNGVLAVSRGPTETGTAAFRGVDTEGRTVVCGVCGSGRPVHMKQLNVSRRCHAPLPQRGARSKEPRPRRKNDLPEAASGRHSALRFFYGQKPGAPDDDDVPNLELQVSRASLPVCPARLAPRALTNYLALIASSCAVAMGSSCLRTREQ